MIVLDTNVVSEPLRRAPDPRVVAWLDAQHVELLALTSITLAEVRYGIAALPVGHRRDLLHERLENEVVPSFAGRILDFDERASVAFARIQAAVRRAGRPLGAMDGLIAAICAAHGARVAARDVTGFAAAGLEVVDPWASRE